MDATPREHLDNFVQAVNNLYAATVHDEDVRAASEAAANLASGSGYLNAPTELIEAFTQAIEVGYAAALSDIRRGDLDSKIEGWRPDLFTSE
ncbi:hypothetical protein AB0F44_00830 [Nocardioides sp. NPDC023903]|uniref:hypothetical protein n=1 Tax=Nocardioides sp. NPDC023903 TaxID=3157195 RepID=UPI0033CE3215